MILLQGPGRNSGIVGRLDYALDIIGNFRSSIVYRNKPWKNLNYGKNHSYYPLF